MQPAFGGCRCHAPHVAHGQAACRSSSYVNAMPLSRCRQQHTWGVTACCDARVIAGTAPPACPVGRAQLMHDGTSGGLAICIAIRLLHMVKLSLHPCTASIPVHSYFCPHIAHESPAAPAHLPGGQTIQLTMESSHMVACIQWQHGWHYRQKKAAGCMRRQVVRICMLAWLEEVHEKGRAGQGRRGGLPPFLLDTCSTES